MLTNILFLKRDKSARFCLVLRHLGSLRDKAAGCHLAVQNESFTYTAL